MKCPNKGFYTILFFIYTHILQHVFTKHTWICMNIWLLQVDRVKRIWYLSHMRAAKVQASLRIPAVSPEPSLLAHISSESRGTFRQKARSLASLNGWACAVKICHDRMLEDTNSLDRAQIIPTIQHQKAYNYPSTLPLYFAWLYHVFTCIP